MARILVLLILLAAVGFIVFQIVSFFFSINNTKSQKKRDLARLKDSLQPLVDNLVALSDDELELLSINKADVSTKPGLNPEITGAFTSIYHEPLVVYGEKTYGPAGNEKITVIYTSEHELVYVTKGTKTEVSVDDHLLGTIHSDGNLYDTKGRQVAYIEADDLLATHPVKIGTREVGEIINPTKAASPNPRAYSFLQPMDDDERVLFMALTLLSLVEESH